MLNRHFIRMWQRERVKEKLGPPTAKPIRDNALASDLFIVFAPNEINLLFIRFADFKTYYVL